MLCSSGQEYIVNSEPREHEDEQLILGAHCAAQLWGSIVKYIRRIFKICDRCFPLTMELIRR